MAFGSLAGASIASSAPAPYLPTSKRQLRRSRSFFGRRLGIFAGKSDSPPSSRPVSILSISSPIPDSFVDLSAGTSPTPTSPSSRANSIIPSSPYLYERPSRPHSVASFASPIAENRSSSPASSMFASQQPRKVRRKPVPTYVDPSESMDQVDVVGLGRLQVEASAEVMHEHKRTSSAGTEGMWASGRDSFMCRELESPLHGSKEEDSEEEMHDGLWTTSSDLTSSGLDDFHRSSPSRQSSFSSFSSLRISPCLSSAPFRPPRSTRRSHSRTSSSVSYQGIQIPPSPALGSPRTILRQTSWALPELELPFMPTLFPTEGEEPYVFVAEPTPLATDISNPFDSLSSPPLSSSSYSSSTSSHDSASTTPTELGDDDVSAMASAPSPPPRRPSLFRVMSEGKSYFIEAPVEGSPRSRSSIYSFKSAQEEASSNEVVLEIKLSR